MVRVALVEDEEEPTVVERPSSSAGFSVVREVISVSVRFSDGVSREYRVRDTERNRAALSALSKRR